MTGRSDRESFKIGIQLNYSYTIIGDGDVERSESTTVINNIERVPIPLKTN